MVLILIIINSVVYPPAKQVVLLFRTLCVLNCPLGRNKNHRKGDSDCYYTACGFFQHLRVLKDMIDHLYGSCEIETIGDPFIDRDTK